MIPLVNRLDRFQQKRKTTSVAIAVFKKYSDDNGSLLATQLTYSSFVALFPLLLLLTSALGVLLVKAPGIKRRILQSAFVEFPIVGTQIKDNIHTIAHVSIPAFVVSALGLLYGSRGLSNSAIFVTQQAWGIPASGRPGFWSRTLKGMEFTAYLGSGTIAVTMLSGWLTGAAPEIVLRVAATIVAILLSCTLYLGAFKMLTPLRLPMRKLMPGSLAGGLAWWVLESVGSYLVRHAMRSASGSYGMFAVVIGLLAWVLLVSEVTLLSTELNVVLYKAIWPRSLVSDRGEEVSIGNQNQI